jgi:hypothetical protein
MAGQATGLVSNVLEMLDFWLFRVIGSALHKAKRATTRGMIARPLEAQQKSIAEDNR